MELIPIRGRGASHNPPNRFEKLHVELEPVPGDPGDPEPRTETQYFRDHARSILARNDSPDVPFSVSINCYRGCSHGCIYCYARPNHEYLGFSAGLDFETRIMVKEDAPALLRRELSSPRWRPEVVAMSGVTDPYQPVERKLRLTRGCLEVLAEARNPVGIVTKNHLVTRDADLLGELARFGAALVFLSITTLDPKLQRVMEPRTSIPARRLDAIRELADAGIPTGVMVAPVIPGLTDHEMPAILEAAARAGARSAGYVPLRLPFAVKDLFERWLEQHFPDRRNKVLNRIRELRGGRLNDAQFHGRMRGEGIWAAHLKQLFRTTCKRLGMNERSLDLSTEAFRRIGAGPQYDLF
ncbi:MAG: PA0069 family radical SAM protein [Gemmatimonadota bacterium]